MAKKKSASKSTSAPRAAAKKKAADKPEAAAPKKAPGPKIIYDKFTHYLCMEGQDRPPINAEQAKKILGWKEENAEGSNVQFGNDYLFRHKRGDKSVKIRCTANVTNRPLYMSNVAALRQEILRGRWEYNGEPIILGCYGHVLNGQHQLIALVLADEMYREDPSSYPELKGEPTIDKLVSVGVSEADHVVNTMDTCKPRTLADVVYRSEFFKDLTTKNWRIAAKILGDAVGLLWVRTGENLDGQSPRRTHSESVNFIERHPRIVEAASHVMTEDADRKISTLIKPGFAAALLYMFAASKTDQGNYLDSDKLDESVMDFSLWEDACDFFTDFAGAAARLVPARRVLAQYHDEGIKTQDSKLGVVIKAWLGLQKKKSISVSDVQLSFGEEDGELYLDDFPVIGGVDIGSLKDLADAGGTPKQQEERAARQKELDERKAQEEKEAKKKAEAEAAAKKKADAEAAKTTAANKPAGKSRGRQPAGVLGKTMWAISDDGEAYQVRVTAVQGKTAECEIQQGFQGAGTTIKKPVASLTPKQPVAAG